MKRLNDDNKSTYAQDDDELTNATIITYDDKYHGSNGLRDKEDNNENLMNWGGQDTESTDEEVKSDDAHTRTSMYNTNLRNALEEKHQAKRKKSELVQEKPTETPTHTPNIGGCIQGIN